MTTTYAPAGAVHTRPAAAPGSDRVRRLARATGAVYLAVGVLGMFAPLVLESVLVPGDAAATAAAVTGARPLFLASVVAWVAVVVLDVVLSALLYRLLRASGATWALVVAALRLAYSALLGALLVHLAGAVRATDPDAGIDPAAALAALEGVSAGFTLALVLFGAHLTALGLLLLRSGLVPRVLAVLLAVAGAGYVVDSTARLLGAEPAMALSAVLLAPAVLGEYGLAGWLLVKGVRTGGPASGRR